jgi:RimJ/RimL family protein N-acetyltransferase
MHPTLETDRLLLRPISEDDINDLFEFFADIETTKFLPGTKTRDQVKEWISLVFDSYQKDKFGPLAVINKSSNDFLGYCGIYQYKDIDGAEEIEILYGLLKRYLTMGYATEAAKKIYEYGKNDLKINRFISIIHPDNANSVKVAEKVGMRFEKEVIVWGKNYRIYAI